MTEARFIVRRETFDGDRRWAYIDSCPHGMDLGAICLGPRFRDDKHIVKERDSITWEWVDLENGRCQIYPSILARQAHGTKEHPEDCHFGPGEFPFIWLEEGEVRDREPFQSRYVDWLKKMGKPL